MFYLPWYKIPDLIQVLLRIIGQDDAHILHQTPRRKAPAKRDLDINFKILSYFLYLHIFLIIKMKMCITCTEFVIFLQMDSAKLLNFK